MLSGVSAGLRTNGLLLPALIQLLGVGADESSEQEGSCIEATCIDTRTLLELRRKFPYNISKEGSGHEQTTSEPSMQ